MSTSSRAPVVTRSLLVVPAMDFRWVVVFRYVYIGVGLYSVSGCLVVLCTGILRCAVGILGAC